MGHAQPILPKKCKILGWNNLIELSYENVTTNYCDTSLTNKLCTNSQVRKVIILVTCTGKSLSEALILATTNPQYDKRLFIENYKLRTCCVHNFCFCFDIKNNLYTQHALSLEFQCTELAFQ